VSARSLVLALVAACASLSACHREAPRRPPAMRSQAMDLAAVPPTVVSGSLRGQPFRTVEAWYRVVRMPGRERVDLIFSEGRATRLCGESSPELARHVWVRFPGVTRLAVGVQRVDPPAVSPFSVHYEWAEHDKWAGHGGGSAAIGVDAVTPGTIVGRAKICFGDATQSCVAGSFRAQECRNELDLDGPRSGVRQREGAPPQ
jgi:hypothetical protein